MKFAPLVVSVLPGLLYACETTPEPDPGCEAHSQCSGGTPFCEADTRDCIEAPPGSELGWGDGSADSVTLTVVLQDVLLKEATDLAFNPSAPDQLWVVNRKDDSIVILTNPGDPAMTFERRRDPAAGHFMDRPPAIAMGSVDDEWGQTFGVCGDSDNGGDDFMGPALFSTMLDVFAEATGGGLGSHLDMLHSTTFCRGIAHGGGNVYYVFNSDKKSIDQYDFAEDHDPGNDDHSDGIIRRYIAGAVLGVDGVPSHLAFDAAANMLYVADTGNGRVLALDTASGTVGATFGGPEPADRKRIDDATSRDVVAPGVLGQPSGIELSRGLVLVSDTATSRFHAFDLEGKEVRSLDTGLPPGTLAGFTVGPDGKVYFVDLPGSRVLRIDPNP